MRQRQLLAFEKEKEQALGDRAGMTAWYKQEEGRRRKRRTRKEDWNMDRRTGHYLSSLLWLFFSMPYISLPCVLLVAWHGRQWRPGWRNTGSSSLLSSLSLSLSVSSLVLAHAYMHGTKTAGVGKHHKNLGQELRLTAVLAAPHMLCCAHTSPLPEHFCICCNSPLWF